MDDLKLLPCPFCGGKDIRFMGYPGMYQNSHYECKDCHTIGPAVFVDDEKAAIAAWNRRAVPQANAEQDAPLSIVSNHEFMRALEAYTDTFPRAGKEALIDLRKTSDYGLVSAIDAAIRAASKTTPSSGEGE